MASFVLLGKYTPQALADLSAKRTKEAVGDNQKEQWRSATDVRHIGSERPGADPRFPRC